MLKINIDDISFNIKLVKDKYLINVGEKPIGNLRVYPFLFFHLYDKNSWYDEIIENNLSYIVKNILDIDKFFCFDFKDECLIGFKEIDKIKQGIMHITGNIYDEGLEFSLFNDESSYYYLKRKNETYEHMVKDFFCNIKCDNPGAFIDILKDSSYHEIYKIAKKIKYELML